MGLKINGYEIVNWINVAQDEGQMKDSFEHDERAATIKAEKCLDLLSDYQIIKIDSAPYNWFSY
jgi:hypothetical protein